MPSWNYFSLLSSFLWSTFSTWTSFGRCTLALGTVWNLSETLPSIQLLLLHYHNMPAKLSGDVVWAVSLNWLGLKWPKNRGKCEILNLKLPLKAVDPETTASPILLWVDGLVALNFFGNKAVVPHHRITFVLKSFVLSGISSWKWWPDRILRGFTWLSNFVPD